MKIHDEISENKHMLYKLIDDGQLTKLELASLYDGEELIGDLQINYYSNGIKNMAHIERVRILDKYQGHPEHYGSFMMDEVIKHITDYKPEFDTSCLEYFLASDAEDLDDRLEAASSRGIDRIHLECSSELESFYSRSGFKRKGDGLMEIVLNQLPYSSLE